MEDLKRQSVHFDDEIFLRGDVYYYRGTPDGRKKQVELSLRVKKGAAQKDILRAKKAAIDGMLAVGTRATKNAFDLLAKEYVATRWEEAEDPNILSKHTAYETDSIINLHMIPFFGSKRLEEFEQADFAEYCLLKKRKDKINLVNHRKVLNHFFKWSVQQSFLKYRPEFAIPKTAQKERRKRVVLTESEIKKLVAACSGRTLLYVSMYLFMGMRNMEICKLKWSDVDFKKRALKIDRFSNRTRRERVIPINKIVLELLRGAFNQKNGDYVFPSAVKSGKYPHINPSRGIRTSWETALKKSELVGKITPHDLRSTFETHMHTNKNFTDTQREKMAGAAIDVQKNIYVTMDVDHLRGLEKSVNVSGLDELFRAKFRESTAKPILKKKVTSGKQKGKTT